MGSSAISTVRDSELGNSDRNAISSDIVVVILKAVRYTAHGDVRRKLGISRTLLIASAVENCHPGRWQQANHRNRDEDR